METHILGRLCLPIVVVASLSGCGTGGTIETRPAGVNTALVLSADKRAILTGANPHKAEETITCAEPQPDAVRAVAQELASSIKGSGVISGVDAEAAASLAAAAREAVGELGRRTPTIQLMRDTLYRACEAMMNGVFVPDDPMIPVVVMQLDNVMLGPHAIDGLTGMGTVGKTVISAETSAPAKASSSGDGTNAETGVVKLTATAAGDGSSTLDKDTAKAIATAVVDIVRLSLTDRDRVKDTDVISSQIPEIIRLRQSIIANYNK